MILASLPQLGTMHKSCRAISPMRSRQTSGGRAADQARPPMPDPLAGLVVELVRSTRRRRTISARLDGDRLIVQVPAGLSAAEERAWAEKLGAKLLAGKRRREIGRASCRERV